MGLNASFRTALRWPVRGRPRGVGRNGSVTSHNRTVLSVLPLAMMCRTGLNATVLT